MQPLAKVINAYQEKINVLDDAAIEKLKVNNELEMSEWLAMGNMPSRMLLEGIVSADVAQHLHDIHTRYNSSATIAEQTVFLQAIMEFLSKTH